jgi:predicted transcriptional regulator
MTKKTSYRRIVTTIGGFAMHRQKGTLNTPQSIIARIIIQHKAGRTIADLAKEYGKTYETVKSMIKRENKKNRRVEAGINLHKQRGRKPAVTLQEYKYENKRLKMENDLLRDFLQVAGKR